jgi:hypothetical protein
MICKMIKYGVVGTAATLLVGGLVFGTDLGSYVRSGGRSFSAAVKDNVPIEFELRRARDLLDDIIPEMHASIRAIAEQEVEIASLRAEIADSEKAVAEAKGQVGRVREVLAKPGDSFRVGYISYTRDELKDDLSRRFERTKEAEMVLAGKKRLLGNREKSLAAANQLFEKTRNQRVMLENQIAALESQHKMVQLASVGSGVKIDHSKLAQTEQLIAQIKKQLDVAERVLAHKAKFVDPSVPVSGVNEKELLSEVDSYLSGPQGDAASQPQEAKGSNNGQVEEDAEAVTRADRY